MKERDIENISAVINYIEAHLDSRLDLDTIARAASYSRYHLHRMFTSAAGITPHDYVLRRQLTRPPNFSFSRRRRYWTLH